MNLSKRLHVILVLSLVFMCSFLAVFFWISNTQSAYSFPQYSGSSVGEVFPFMIGPASNSVNVSLDTVIAVSPWRGSSVSNFRSTPEISIARRVVEIGDSPSATVVFYPAEPLEPATTYNVTVFIHREDVTWSFTTTSEPFHPELRHYLVNYALWIALSTATAATLVVGFAIRLRKKQTQP